MLGQWIKQFLPRGLYGRAALILIVPVITLQLVVSAVILQRHFDGVTRQMTRAVATELGLILDIWSREGQAAAEEVAVPLGFTLRLRDLTEPVENTRVFWDLSGRTVTPLLTDRLPEVVGVDLARDGRQVFVALRDPVVADQLIEAQFARSRVSASNPHQLLVWMIVVGLLMTAVAYVFLRNQLRPVTRLARAATAFGRGRTVPYRVAGATEVREAGQAFLDMRARIERQIEQRTLMVSGVSHDLRTPLTRMRLELGMLDGDADGIAALTRDIAEMEMLIDAFLEFARGAAVDDPELANPAEVLRAAVEDARRAGGDVSLTLPDDATALTAMFRPQAVRRALMNLFSNSLRYGNRARAELIIGETTLVFRVEDDGPGIAPEDRADAIKPFVRLDAARNQDLGSGVGLGLAIAHDIARSHGGMLRLSRSETLGGLSADLVIAR